jgi:hypothetical protein
VHTRVVPLVWRADPVVLADIPGKLLPSPAGAATATAQPRETLLDVSGLDRFIAFDQERGLLRCEQGH